MNGRPASAWCQKHASARTTPFSSRGTQISRLFGGSILYLIADFTIETFNRIPELLV